jgi:hypothetical protein
LGHYALFSPNYPYVPVWGGIQSIGQGELSSFFSTRRP